ncbi:hypothetical protein M405DRAFT_883015 [Rhizopogon salebrosus TDB-379]|nr:hypothetical protein M405DRAFT_883015 [Rhizopogon salebrosus TDB-379]
MPANSPRTTRVQDDHSVLHFTPDEDPAPQYRHASPSGPWPWMDFSSIEFGAAMTESTVITTEDGMTATTNGASWQGYPENLFGNWKSDQVERSQMLKKCLKNNSSNLYWIDVCDDRSFITPTISKDEFLDMSQPEPERRPENIRVRLLFVDDLTPHVLQILGTRYNIEPFFFTSSINWIPSRYQEALDDGRGDHITITLPFVRTSPAQSDPSRSYMSRPIAENQIDTQAPLKICNNSNVLSIDLLAIHMIRDVKRSTIIYYHPESKLSSARRLHSLMLLVGQSVYWKNIFSKSNDPTFLLLAILWYALYTWDESFELLYKHVSKLESDVLTESRVEHTRDLHILQAYLLHYESLIHGIHVSVSFIRDTPNPGMEATEVYKKQREVSNRLMKKECENLLGEIDRLQKLRGMLSDRLKNVMSLAFANVNIRDSASTRQITYLTTIFLPASLIASVFGMNVKEINPGSLETLVRYVWVTIVLTLITVYVVVTLQAHTSFHEPGAGLQRRAAWPILFIWKMLPEKVKEPVPSDVEEAPRRDVEEAPRRDVEEAPRRDVEEKPLRKEG